MSYLKRNIQADQSQTWDAIFAGIPTVLSTQAEQVRHQELRNQDELTEAEEAELNDLFHAIYPQFLPRPDSK